MNMTNRSMWLAALVVGLARTAFGQSAIEEGQVRLLGIPIEALGGKASLWTGKPLEFAIKTESGAVVVQDKPDWRVLGFPPLVRLKVTKMRSNGDIVSVEFRGVEDSAIRMRVTLPQKDADTLVRETFPLESEEQDYSRKAREVLLQHFDGTALAGIAESRKLDLLAFGHIHAKAAWMGGIEHGGHADLHIDLGAENVVYNDLKMDQSQRIARIVCVHVLPVLGRVVPRVKDVPQIGGLKLGMDVAHRDFSRKLPIAEDHLESHTSAETIQKFGEGKIAAQELIDESLFTVNGVQVAPKLSCDLKAAAAKEKGE